MTLWYWKRWLWWRRCVFTSRFKYLSRRKHYAQHSLLRGLFYLILWRYPTMWQSHIQRHYGKYINDWSRCKCYQTLLLHRVMLN
jgi:hypothetical protein